MVRKALLIGINYNNSSSQLNGCHNDVKNMNAFLIEKYGLKEEETKILMDDHKHQDPTKANIIQGLLWLTKNANSGSQLFLHYSGHGSYTKDRGGDEEDGRDECICPLDYSKAGMISDDYFRKAIIQPLPKGCELFCVMDCCHSGTVMDLKYTYKVQKHPKKNSYSTIVDKHYKPTQAKIIMISGSLDTQYSSDAFLPGGGSSAKQFQGAMTYSLLNSYRDLSKNGKHPTLKRLTKRLLIFIKEKGFEQIPQLSSGNLMSLEEEIHML